MRFMAERGDRCTSMRQRVWTGESTTRTATSIGATTSATGATKWTPRRLGAVETGGAPLGDLRALHRRRRYGSGRKAHLRGYSKYSLGREGGQEAHLQGYSKYSLGREGGRKAHEGERAAKPDRTGEGEPKREAVH